MRSGRGPLDPIPSTITLVCMLAKVIGTELLAARRSAGFTQAEVAAIMGTTHSSISRAETGRSVPTLDFVERYARAIRRPIAVRFGDGPAPSWEERVTLAGRAFGSWFRERNGRYYPQSADIILRKRVGIPPADLYVETLNWAVHDGPGWHKGASEPFDLRAPIAVAAMYHDVIDWRAVRVSSDRRLLDRRARRRARGVISSIHSEM